MQILTPGQLRTAFNNARAKGISLRCRFIVYILMIVFALTMIVFVLLSVFGILNPAYSDIEHTLNQQLEMSATVMEHDIDEMAAYAVSLSEQMSVLIENFLKANAMTFEELRNNSEKLSALQSEAYALVYTGMQLSPCSGGFYLLNTTVNDALSDDYYNGLYLKFANLYAENTIRNKVCLFRGASTVARENDINLHSSWQYETKADSFTALSDMLNSPVARDFKGYFLTSIYPLPDTWENVRFLCVPILDSNGQLIGICGFEISDLYFQLTYKTISEQEYTICGLFDQTEDGYVGQIAGNKKGYTSPIQSNFSIQPNGNLFDFQSGELVFVGKMQEIAMGNSKHMIAVMLPSSQYNAYLHIGQLKTIACFCIIVVIAVGASLLFSKKYIAPILKSVQQIKTDMKKPIFSHISEIDDLFEFLAQKDQENEDKLKMLEEQKQTAEKKYEKVQTQIVRLVDKKMDEIDPDSFQMFLNHLHMLTPREKEVFDYYLEGKTAKEIHTIMGINENTVKFHNKNIYSKLGVSSRKQLLQYAELMRQQQR